MSIIKVGPNHEITLPQKVCSALGVNPGDSLKITLHDKNSLLLSLQQNHIPMTKEPIGPKTYTSLQRALKDVEEGRVSSPFKSGPELIAHLDQIFS
jgi:bifunctional DNA-binding transcriptional regulator/antitoxin component of YhaV-PrlF toxin-antitoxin module